MQAILNWWVLLISVHQVPAQELCFNHIQQDFYNCSGGHPAQARSSDASCLDTPDPNPGSCTSRDCYFRKTLPVFSSEQNDPTWRLHPQRTTEFRKRMGELLCIVEFLRVLGSQSGVSVWHTGRLVVARSFIRQWQLQYSSTKLLSWYVVYLGYLVPLPWCTEVAYGVRYVVSVLVSILIGC